MSDILNKTIVLVLNRNWQAINIRTPRTRSARWPRTPPPRSTSSWRRCPRGSTPSRGLGRVDHAADPRRGQRRAHHARRDSVPTVIVAVNFAKVPKKRPKLSARNIRERDGNRCQYTGRLLHPD